MWRLRIVMTSLLVVAVMLGVASAQEFQPGNPTCEDMGYDLGLRIETPSTGTFTSGPFTVIIGADNFFDWSSGMILVDAVIAKGGPNANIYRYDPPATSGFGLSAPINPNNNQPFGLSHVDFCYREPQVIEEELTVSKTATALYDRQISWTLSKEVEPTTLFGSAGGVAGDAIWSIAAERLIGEPINHRVSGLITIANPADATVTFEAVDTLFSAGDVAVGSVMVDCPAWTLPPGTSETPSLIECSYQATGVDPSAVINRVNVVVTDVSYTGYDIILVSGDSAEAPLNWTEQLLGEESAMLSDPRLEPGPLFPRAVPPTVALDVGEEFLCPADVRLYEAGAYSYTVTNTVFLTNADVALVDDATLTVICDLPALAAAKTALAGYDRTVDWSLEKSVDIAAHSGTAGSIAGNSIFTVVATKSESVGNHQVSGDITINNTSLIDQTFDVSDTLNDGTPALVSCPSNTVAAGSSITCSYVAMPADDAATLNTATVSAPGNPAITASAPVVFVENLIGFDSGLLEDPLFGYSQAISSTTVLNFPAEFDCTPDATLYVGGSYSYDILNIATLSTPGGTLSDEAGVDVLCDLPALAAAKTALAGYDRTVDWTLEKSATPTAHSGLAGTTVGTSEFVIVATKSESLGNYWVSGEITISNSAAIAQAFDVSDTLSDGTPAMVHCPTYLVPAGGSVTCSYVAMPADNAATLNTATVGAPGNPAITASAAVVFVENLIGFEGGPLADPMFDLNEDITSSTTRSFQEPMVCPPNSGQYIDGFLSFTVSNTATLGGGIGLSASATVDVVCEDPEKPGRPSLEVNGGRITSAARGSDAVVGWFEVSNASSGVTFVTISDVSISFISRLPRGIRVDHSASCTISPTAEGYTLSPNETQTFNYVCAISPAVAANANELTARIVVGTATNQAGEVRDRSFFDNSSAYRF